MKRIKRINLRLSEQERRAMEIIAQREGQGLSELTRKLIREGIEKRGLQTVGLVDLLYREGVKDDTKS
jgi:SOS response regulatory protein OraA/RecX